jgi:hypothetical protein
LVSSDQWSNASMFIFCVFLFFHTGRIMKYQVMSYHDISVKYHKPDMAMIGNIKNRIHISIW